MVADSTFLYIQRTASGLEYYFILILMLRRENTMFFKKKKKKLCKHNIAIEIIATLPRTLINYINNIILNQIIIIRWKQFCCNIYKNILRSIAS